MRKAFQLVLCGIIVSVFLIGCLGSLAEQSQSNQDGAAASAFEPYSKMAQIENGVSIIKVNNELSSPGSLKITVAEDLNAWKIFDIPAQNST